MDPLLRLARVQRPRGTCIRSHLSRNRHSTRQLQRAYTYLGRLQVKQSPRRRICVTVLLAKLEYIGSDLSRMIGLSLHKEPASIAGSFAE